MILQRLLLERDTSWSKLSHYLRVVYRLCHDDAASANHTADLTQERIRTVGRLPDEQYQLYLTRPVQPKNAKVLKVSIIGEPNSGKSTLVNRLLGWRVNAVSSRVHTTRKNTQGVLTEGNTQIMFVDTPGVITAFQRRKHKCDPNMLTDPESSVNEVDAVGVVVDVSNKWTRQELNREVLKVLHLHPDVTSFLILNKVDALKKRNLLLEITRKLTCGIVGGNEAVFPDRIKGPDKNTMINMNDKYFTKLEQRYGRIKHKKKTSSAMFLEAYQQQMASANQDKMVFEKKKDELINKQSFENVNDEIKTNSSKVILGEADQTVCDQMNVDEVVNSVDTSEDSIEDSESSTTLDDLSLETLEKSYQTEFLRQLRANAKPSKHKPVDNTPDTSWTEKMERIKEASQAKGWSGFDRVFMVSALNGEATEDILNYLFDSAKPGDWEFNSSLVTTQHPYDIAKMCVWQCLLDNVPDWLPYSANPEIVFWHVDQYDRLDIVIEVTVDCQLQRFIGQEGETVKTISNQARQALLDAFQCEISFKLMIKQKSRREQKKRS